MSPLSLCAACLSRVGAGEELDEDDEAPRASMRLPALPPRPAVRPAAGLWWRGGGMGAGLSAEPLAVPAYHRLVAPMSSKVCVPAVFPCGASLLLLKCMVSIDGPPRDTDSTSMEAAGDLDRRLSGCFSLLAEPPRIMLSSRL